jgi:hypothetical protein
MDFTGTQQDGSQTDVTGRDLFTFHDGKIAIKKSSRKTVHRFLSIKKRRIYFSETKLATPTIQPNAFALHNF